tara:strand:+ start:13882 stop:15255 length:1374 start_codon:yes stop_codon:yes gene_type:complete
MLFYFSSVLSLYLLPTLLLGLVWSKSQAFSYRVQLLAGLVAMLCGVTLAAYLPSQYVVLFNVYMLYLTVFIGALAYLLLSELNRFVVLALSCMLILSVSILWNQTVTLHLFDFSHGLNTELLLNCAGVVLGFITVGMSLLLIAHTSRTLTSKQKIGIATFSLVGLIPPLGEMMLAMMKLQWLEMNSFNVTFIAKATDVWTWIPYVALTGWLMVQVFYHRYTLSLKAEFHEKRQVIAKRKAQSKWFDARHIGLTQWALLVLLSADLVYWDQIGSQPAQRSEAFSLTLAEDGMIHIPIDEALTDGTLHRFSWTTEAGNVIRFFVINRFDDRVKLGVAFDACLLCKDQGYIQEDRQVVCLGCQVRIFKPSIGKPGGCNPIPLTWSQKEQELLIDAKDLRAGKKYFTEVKEITVVDPVSQETLTNLKAHKSFEYAGHIYFFSDEMHYRQFVVSPERYIGGA